MSQQNWQYQAPQSPKQRWPWIVGGFAVAAVIAGIAGAATSEPPAVAEPVAPVMTQEPAPTPEPTPEEPEPDPTSEEPVWDSTGYDETLLILEVTWGGTDAEERDDLCWGWDFLGEDYVVETLNSEGTFNEDAIRDFFEEVC